MSYTEGNRKPSDIYGRTSFLLVTYLFDKVYYYIYYTIFINQ